MKPKPDFTKHARTANRFVAGHGERLRVRRRPARGRRLVDPARLAGVTIHLPQIARPRPLKAGRAFFLLAAAVLAGVAYWLWGNETSGSAEPESVFLFEDIPPEPAPQARPDPSPPPPNPPAEVLPETPPPQFGLQEEQLSEHGELAVATGNTLMTGADTVVRSPVDGLPAAPPLIDLAPRILKGRPPDYPYRALERGLEATVIVLITIDTLGRVSQVEVERSGGRDFDPEVLRAVKGLVFQPPVRNGRRVAARFRQPYEFRIQ